MFLSSLLSLNAVGVVAFVVAYLSAILTSLSFHEFAHAFVATHEGDPTAKAQKRLTLKPLSHIDPIGFITLLIFGFGWAKPVPVDFRNLKRGRVSEFRVSVAGIVMNLLLAFCASFIYCVLGIFAPKFLFAGNFYSLALETFLSLMLVINLCLAFFNLLPIYPLDGFRVVESCCKTKDNNFSNFMRKYSNLIMLVVLISGISSIYLNLTAVNLAELLLKMWVKIFGLI